ncbi:MAG TPA: multicopper oxidase domain-containing protein [Burkholderiales bacterium]|nr:multicopper oxidase domain-containing protein [Burkholderiales bacterium]
MNRREFLAIGAASIGAACSLPPARAPAAASQAVPLSAVRKLVVELVDPLLGRCQYVADTGTQRIARPILLARRGDRFDAVIENRLPQPTTIHFHGLTLSEAQDGAGFDPIPPGGSKPLAFRIRNRSGLYWFHPHPHGFTAEQVYSGLVGLVVVGDEDDAALDQAMALSPTNRLALAIADVRVAGGALRPYAPSSEDCHTGWLGNRVMVNGAIEARYPVAPGWVRLQLLNACNARGLLLAFRAADLPVPFFLLGTDGGLLSAPRALDRVFLHPAERVDVVLDARPHGSVDAISLEYDPRRHAPAPMIARPHPARARFPALAAENICGPAGARPAGEVVAEGERLPLFSLTVEGEHLPPRALPQRLSSLAEATPPLDAGARRMRLDLSEQRGFLIDNQPYELDEIAFSAARGAREVWEVRNSPVSMPHPMHLHGFGFRVLRRQGTFGPARALAGESAGRLPTDLGVKDTVVVWPNETLWLAVDFTLPDEAAFRGRQRYMFHCHNLEHEDGMMMRNFAVL